MARNYYLSAFDRAFNATPETRRASLEHWETIHAENKKNNRFDLIIFSAENIRAINTADKLNMYLDYAGMDVNFEKTRAGYKLEILNGETVYFYSVRAIENFVNAELSEISPDDWQEFIEQFYTK